MVTVMRERATATVMREKAMVIAMREKATVTAMREKATATVMREKITAAAMAKKIMGIFRKQANMAAGTGRKGTAILTVRERGILMITGRAVPAAAMTMITIMPMKYLPVGDWRHRQLIRRRRLQPSWSRWKTRASMALCCVQKAWFLRGTALGYTLTMCPARAMCGKGNRNIPVNSA